VWYSSIVELSFHDISHLSASGSLPPWRYINLLTYLLTYNNNNSYYYFYYTRLYTSSIITIIIMFSPYVGAYALMAVLCPSVCLSVCLSVYGCPVPDPMSRTEWRRQLKIGKM